MRNLDAILTAVEAARRQTAIRANKTPHEHAYPENGTAK